MSTTQAPEHEVVVERPDWAPPLGLFLLSEFEEGDWITTAYGHNARIDEKGKEGCYVKVTFENTMQSISVAPGMYVKKYCTKQVQVPVQAPPVQPQVGTLPPVQVPAGVCIPQQAVPVQEVPMPVMLMNTPANILVLTEEIASSEAVEVLQSLKSKAAGITVHVVPTSTPDPDKATHLQEMKSELDKSIDALLAPPYTGPDAIIPTQKLVPPTSQPVLPNDFCPHLGNPLVPAIVADAAPAPVVVVAPVVDAPAEVVASTIPTQQETPQAPQQTPEAKTYSTVTELIDIGLVEGWHKTLIFARCKRHFPATKAGSSLGSCYAQINTRRSVGRKNGKTFK